MQRLKTLWDRIRRKKEKKEIVWDSDKKEGTDTKTSVIITPSKRSFVFPKIRNTIFLKIKRVLAVILFLIQLAGGFYSVPHIMSLLFFGTALILFDYVWKTRKSNLKWGFVPREE